MTPKNTYFVCLGDDQAPISWNPFNTSQKINLHTDYFGKALSAMESELDGEGWTIYLTWSLSSLPSYGKRVVAVLLGDEWSRIPKYSDRVAAVFKCYGAGLPLGCNPLLQPSYQNWLTLFQYLNARLRYIPGWIRRRWAGIVHKKPLPPIFTIPLGYANQIDIPLKPFGERPFEVSFAGSVVHKPYRWWSLKQWFQTPKSYSRRRMISELKKIEKEHPEWDVDLKITKSYKAIRSSDPNEYSERVMNTKISIAPRGTSYETFRFFEALRFGCVVITEYLPSTWFYDGAPTIQLSDWRHLEATLSALLSNPDDLAKRHREALEWWANKCSEPALGSFMASKLNSLPQQAVSALDTKDVS